MAAENETSPLLHARSALYHEQAIDTYVRRNSMLQYLQRVAVAISSVGVLALLASFAWNGTHHSLRQQKTTTQSVMTKISRDEWANEASSIISSTNGNSNSREGVTIDITNEYSSAGLKMFDYPFLRDAWLMEPYRESVVTVSGLSDECGVQWRLEREQERASDWFADVGLGAQNADVEESISGFSADSSRFVVEAGATGKFRLRLQQSCAEESSDGSSSSSTVGGGGQYEFPIWVKYVRRELSTLTERDREEFLDAMKVLWDVNTVDGRRIYGPQYKSLMHLATVHNDAGAGIVCDEFHRGPGFLYNHALLGSYMEQSMQLVNPRVCLHYMEYTKYYETEAYKVGHINQPNDGGKWTELMTEKWFGSNDPLTGRIVDGRWANAPVPLMDDAFFEAHAIEKYKVFFPAERTHWFVGRVQAHFYNPYGLLRSPWDFSPDPFLLRFNNYDRFESLSGLTVGEVYCSDYQTYIENSVVGHTLEKAMINIEGSAHNGAHFGIAGAGGDLEWENDLKLYEDYGFSAQDIMFTTTALQDFRKTYMTRWLKNTTTEITCKEFPFDYDSGTLSTTAPPGSPAGMQCDILPTYYASEAGVNDFLTELFGAVYGSGDTLTRISLMSAEKQKSLAKLLSGRIQYTGDLASSSAALDPIFWVLHGSVERLFQRIVFEDVLVDTSYTYYARCSGHDFNGTKPWLEGFSFEDRGVDVSRLTNSDFVEIMNPQSELYAKNINFVYDRSDWSWCPDFDSYFER